MTLGLLPAERMATYLDTNLRILIPNAPRPMCRQNFSRLEPLDALLANLDLLRKVPQIKVNQHAAHLLRTRGPHHRATHALDGDDACRADAHLLARAGYEWRVLAQERTQGRWVGQDAEVVQNLWDAVVCEHRQLVHRGAVCAGEEWVRVSGRGRVEGCPSFGNEDLRAFPEVD